MRLYRGRRFNAPLILDKKSRCLVFRCICPAFLYFAFCAKYKIPGYMPLFLHSVQNTWVYASVFAFCAKYKNAGHMHRNTRHLLFFPKSRKQGSFLHPLVSRGYQIWKTRHTVLQNSRPLPCILWIVTLQNSRPLPCILWIACNSKSTEDLAVFLPHTLFCTEQQL